MPNLINNFISHPEENTTNIEIQYPLLAMEKGLLFHTLYDNSSSFYLSQGEVLLNNINSQSFWKAWQLVIQHYEVLRSCFVENTSGLMQQVVHSQVISTLRIVNLETLPLEQIEDAYQKILKQEIQTPFDLTSPPLMRLVLCQMPEKKYRFIWTYHHLLLDLRSAFRILDDAIRSYEAIHSQQSFTLTPLVSKHAILAQLPQLETTQAKTYWQERLKDYIRRDDLPFVGLRNHIPDTTVPLEYTFSVGKEPYLALKQFARQHRLTPSLVAHVAWGLTLCSYLNCDDIVFGSIRSLPYSLIKNSAGLFINNLPMRVRFNTETRIIDCLNDIREQHHQLKLHWSIALGDIQSWLGLSPGESLFNTCISFSTPEANSLIQKHMGDEFNQLQIKFRSNTHVPLMLEFFIQEGGLLGRFTQQPGLFSYDMLEHLSRQFNTVLNQLISNPQQKISKLSWLCFEDCQQLKLWNKTNVPFAECTLSSLLEQQTQRTPNQIAVQFEDKELSYHELNIQANKLGHWLRQQGIRTNTQVAVYMERCLELPVALLGIVKSGGAYVPLDPKFPFHRLSEMVIDSQTTVLLTTTKFATSALTIAKSLDLRIIYLDQEGVFNNCAATNLTHINHPHDDLYVIYTSGSTGKPKAVRNHHLAVAHQLLWMQKTIPLQANDLVLQKTTLSFDVAVWEFFWPWLVGARVILAPPDAQYDVEQLINIINQNKVTVLQFVPTQLDNFIQNNHVSSCDSLRYILSIGEALKQKTAATCLTLLPKATLHNLYGPTETTIASSYYRCKKNDPYNQVPIGRPIDNTQLLLLNRYQQLVPIGGVGELHIGGIGVAKGYLNQPELTTAHFIKRPSQSLIDNSPPKVFYKTGDLVAYSPAGILHFIGRIDNQVKRHGVRVELGEIEARLQQQDGIKQCAVVLQKGIDSECLIAYCIAADLPVPTADLYQQLAQYLPNSMIPTHFVWLPSLPLLANGKLDRAALPPVDDQHKPLKDTTSEANMNISEKLQAIWREVLRLNSVEMHDNLFAIGGDSISVIQIANKARAAGIEIYPKWIFKQPTLAGLSKLISAKKSDDLKLETKRPIQLSVNPSRDISPPNKQYKLKLSLALQSYGVKDIYPLSPTQRGILFHSMGKDSKLFYITQLSLTLTGELKLALFREAWEEVTTEIDLMKTAFFVQKNGEALQAVFNKIPLPIQFIDLRNIKHSVKIKTLNTHIKQDRLTPFLMDTPALFRLSLIALEKDRYIFLYTCHHIISDGWSINLLFKQVIARYFERKRILKNRWIIYFCPILTIFTNFATNPQKVPPFIGRNYLPNLTLQ